MGWLQTWRRNRRNRQLFPDDWKRILEHRFPFYRLLNSEQQHTLKELVRHFMAEKSFEGCGGMKLDESHKVIISAMACTPLLGGVSDLYPYLRAILVYPEPYHAPFSEPDEGGIVSEGIESRSGESWDQGVVVLSWDEIDFDLRNPADGANIVFHECAHQIDYEWGATMENFQWQEARRGEESIATRLKNGYAGLVQKMEQGAPVPIDDYGVTNVHEFFAVLTETWFERRDIIRKHYPDIDQAMASFFNLKGRFPG